MSISDDRTGFPAGRQYAPSDRTNADDDPRAESHEAAHEPSEDSQWREPSDPRRSADSTLMSSYLDDPVTDRGPQPSHGYGDRMSHADNGHEPDHGPAEAPKRRVNAFGLPIQEPDQSHDLPPADALRKFTEPLKRASVVPEDFAQRPAPEAPPARAERPEPHLPEPPARAERPEPHLPEPPARAERPEPHLPEPPARAERPEPYLPEPPVHVERSEPPLPQPPAQAERPEPPRTPERNADADPADRFIADDPDHGQLAATPRAQPGYDPFDFEVQDLDEAPDMEEGPEPVSEPATRAGDDEPDFEEAGFEEIAAQAAPEKGLMQRFDLGRFFRRKRQPEADEAETPDLEDAYQARHPDDVGEDADFSPDLAAETFETEETFEEDPQPPAEVTEPLRSDDGKTIVRSGARPVPARDVRGRTRSWDELEGADAFGTDALKGKSTDSYRELDDDFDDAGEADISEPVYGGLDAPETELEGEYDEADALHEDAEFPFPEERKKRRGALVAAALVGAIALGGALAFAYKVISEPGGNGSPPVIQADDSPTKVEPAQPGGRTFANQNKLIYDRLDGQGQDTAERVIPRSEEAQELPSPPAKAGDAGDGSASLTDRVREAISTPKPEASAPAAAADGTPNPRRVRTLVIRPDGTVVQQETAAPAEAAPSAPSAGATAPEPTVAAEPPAPAAEAPAKPQEETVAAAEPAAAPAASTGSGGFVVQLGARRSQTAALADFADLQQKYPKLLRDYKPLIQRADLGSRGVYYRLRVGPLDNKGAANRLCTRLKSAGLRDCLVRTQ